jgi:hypothetical protein
MTSRRAHGGVMLDGSRNAETKYYSRAANLFPLPSGSLPVSQLEPLDLSQSRLNKPLLFALAANFLAWIFIVLAIRALISVLF